MVTRKLGGRRSIAARAEGGVSPVRTSTRSPGAAIPMLGGHLGDLAQRDLEVLVDVDGQRLERGDVDDLGRPLHRLAARGGEVQLVDGDQEAGQRLARAGGRGDERRLAGRDVRPALLLRRGGAVGEALLEPRPHRGMEEAHRVKVAPGAAPAAASGPAAGPGSGFSGAGATSSGRRRRARPSGTPGSTGTSAMPGTPRAPCRRTPGRAGRSGRGPSSRGASPP